MYKVQDYVILCLVLQKLNLTMFECFLYMVKRYIPVLPLRYLKAVSGNSINSSQNLVLAQILLWHR